jgi:hypothetical protein
MRGEEDKLNPFLTVDTERAWPLCFPWDPGIVQDQSYLVNYLQVSYPEQLRNSIVFLFFFFSIGN